MTEARVTGPEKSLARRLALPLAVGAISGAAATTAFMVLTGGVGQVGLGLSREIAGLVGVLYMLMALGVGAGIANPNVGARFLNVEDADELREQRRMLGFSCLGMVTFGAALLVLALVEPAGSIDAGMGAAIAAVLIIATCGLSLYQAREIDELQQAMSRDASATALLLLFVVGGGWALLAHCGLAAGPVPLDWLTMLAVAFLLGCFWQAGRRGLLLRGPN